MPAQRVQSVKHITRKLFGTDSARCLYLNLSDFSVLNFLNIAIVQKNLPIVKFKITKFSQLLQKSCSIAFFFKKAVNSDLLVKWFIVKFSRKSGFFHFNQTEKQI